MAEDLSVSPESLGWPAVGAHEGLGKESGRKIAMSMATPLATIHEL